MYYGVTEKLVASLQKASAQYNQTFSSLFAYRLIDQVTPESESPDDTPRVGSREELFSECGEPGAAVLEDNVPPDAKNDQGKKK